MRTVFRKYLAVISLFAWLVPVASHANDCVFVPGKSICGVPLTATPREFVAILGAPDGEIRLGAHRLGYFYGQRLILIFSRDRLVETEAWETNPNIDFWHDVSNGVGRDSLRLVFPGWSPWGITRKEFARHNDQFPIDDADESAESRTATGVAMTVFYDFCYRAEQQCGNTDDYDAFQVNRINLSFQAGRHEVKSVKVDPTTCPASMPSAVEKKLLLVLDATTETVRTDKAYEALWDQLLDGKDDASVEARVALMDYPIGAAYSELLSCVVSTGGKKALYYLELYSHCDIAPTRSPVPRDHANTLRSITTADWKARHGKGSCKYEE